MSKFEHEKKLARRALLSRLLEIDSLRDSEITAAQEDGEELFMTILRLSKMTETERGFTYDI